MNTDSLMYIIEIGNIQVDPYKHKWLFGFGNYTKWSKYYHGTKGLPTGRTKGKTCSAPKKSLIELKAKICTNITEDRHECMKTKDIDKSAVADIKYKQNKNFCLVN